MQFQRKPHIAAGIEEHHQVVGLEDEAHVQAQVGELLLAGAVELLAEDLEAAVLAGTQAAQHGEQGGLARAGGAGADHDLPRVDVERDVLEGMLATVAAAEPVVHVLERNHRLFALRIFGRRRRIGWLSDGRCRCSGAGAGGRPAGRIESGVGALHGGVRRHRPDRAAPACGWPGCPIPRTSRR